MSTLYIARVIVCDMSVMAIKLNPSKSNAINQFRAIYANWKITTQPLPFSIINISLTHSLRVSEKFRCLLCKSIQTSLISALVLPN